jgi:cobalt-zinc-cadmium efflux system protein
VRARGHNHGHDHGPARHDRAFAIGITLNLAFVCVEAFYGWKVDSLALLADAGHNLSDVIGLVLAWGGALAGRLRPDARHTYGWKRASILAAFINALLLLVAMGSLAWEAVSRLQSPQPIARGHDHGGRRHRHRRQYGHRTAVHARPRERSQHPRRLPAHGGRCAGVGRRGGGRCAGAGFRLGLAGPGREPRRLRRSSWLAPGACSGSRCTCCSTACRKASTCMRCTSCCEGADRVWRGVHDLHVWAMGTSQTALTAHLVMPDGQRRRRLPATRHPSHCTRGSSIEHVTLQVVRVPFCQACDG